MSLRWLCHLSAFSHLLLVLLEELPVCEVISWDRAVGLGPGALVREALGGDALPSPAGPLKPFSGLTHYLPQPPQAPCGSLPSSLSVHGAHKEHVLSFSVTRSPAPCPHVGPRPASDACSPHLGACGFPWTFYTCLCKGGKEGHF